MDLRNPYVLVLDSNPSCQLETTEHSAWTGLVGVRHHYWSAGTHPGSPGVTRSRAEPEPWLYNEHTIPHTLGACARVAPVHHWAYPFRPPPTTTRRTCTPTLTHTRTGISILFLPFLQEPPPSERCWGGDRQLNPSIKHRNTTASYRSYAYGNEVALSGAPEFKA